MQKTIFSALSSVMLVTVAEIISFVRLSAEVRMSPAPYDRLPFIPGSAEISQNSHDDGVIEKVITLKIKDASPDMSYKLDYLKRMDLVASYVDEAGFVRICGSPMWPLSLDYSSQGGVIVVTLTGKDTKPDMCLA